MEKWCAMENMGGKLNLMSNSMGFINSYTYDGFRYFSNVDFNGLFRQNIADENIEFIDYFSDELLTRRLIHRTVIGVDERMFFFPLFGNGITEYHVSEKKFHFWEVNGKKRVWGFSGVFPYIMDSFTSSSLSISISISSG